ncbi:unnamed protein product [Rhizophagus irregularis]|uniref:Endonuclease/exonuclease/phosphatase domain-containing protein n=1 Tax=Rhizophagus irregularis TaxID=588596 RepID=A0A915ZN31_9GLOM|nr:unnamed protein product [Rhizophagus irregularis]
MTSQNHKSSQPLPRNYNNNNSQSGSLQSQTTTTNNSEQRITQLEQQVQLLTNTVKTLQEGKSKVDSTIADIHHNHNLMSSSLNDLTTRLDKATKTRYNLRGNKQGNITAEDSEQPLATDEDTDAPDDTVMSDGAVFEGIIDELSNATPTEPKFSSSEPVLQYSYSKYNNNTNTQKNYKKPQNHKNINQNFHTPYENDTQTSISRNNIREPCNEEDENMLNYIEENIFDDNDTIGISSTSQPYDTHTSSSPQLRTQFIDYHKFGTINIQGGFNNKLNDILHFFTLNNYDILVLTETGLHQHTNMDMNLDKSIHSTHLLPSLNNDNIKQNIHLYTDNKGNTKGSGVSMMITDQLQKHIIKTTTFLGRILTIDLCFKGNHYIKFICCYLPANAVDDKELIIKCYKEIENILTNAMHNHFECIVLGDLNISFDKLKKSNHYPIWRREIKTIFKNFGLKDLLKVFHECPSPTYSSNRNEGPDIQSRIDYIFTSSNILHHSFYAYTHSVTVDLFTTDHKALSCYLTQDYFKNKFNSSRKSLEKSPTYKPNTNPQIHYKYRSMTIESWSNYKITNGIIYRQYINNLTPMDQTPEQQIEFFWSNIKDIIKQTKEKCIPFSTHKKYTKHDRPLYLRQNNNKILTLRTILRKFSNIKIDRIRGDHAKWKDYWKPWGTLRHQLLAIDAHFNAKRTIWLPVNLTIDNIFDVKKDLQSLLRIIIVLHKKEEDLWTINNINKYINDRNNNLLHDQKRMINSILDRKPQKITLDRLHYYDQQTNQFQFTNNPHIIAEQTNLHFQRLGKDLKEINDVKKYKSIQDLPLYWRSTYESINNRDCKHMHSLSEDFSIEELAQVISSLPNNKAAGISGITYEDIKDTHQDFREYIKKFFNYIMQKTICKTSNTKD